MCQQNTQQQMPVPQADPSTMMGGSNPVGAANGSAPDGADPLSQSLAAEAKANPDTVSVTAPTKFGKLAKLLKPILVGGAVGAAVGGATGKSTYGGGFAGAQNFFAQQHQRQLQSIMMQRQQTNDLFHNNLLQQQVQLDQARTAHEINRPNFTGRAITPQAAVVDGRNVFMRNNPDSGEPEEVPGFTPPTKTPTTENDKVVESDQGLFLLHNGKLRPATVGGDESPDASGEESAVPNKAPSQFDSGSPSVPGSAVPRTAPGAGKQLTRGANKPEKEGTPDAQTFTFLTTPKEQGGKGMDPDQARAHMEAQKRLGQKPDKPAADPDAPLQGKEYRKVQTHYNDQLNREIQQSESQRQRDIAASKKENGGELTDEESQRIEEENNNRKQSIHQSIADQASGQGVNLGVVPNYSSQSKGGGAPVPKAAPGASDDDESSQPTVPKYAPGSKIATPDVVAARAKKDGTSTGKAVENLRAEGYTTAPFSKNDPRSTANLQPYPTQKSAPTAKTVTPDIVQAWAQKKNISVAEAQKQFKAKGYAVGGAQ